MAWQWGSALRSPHSHTHTTPAYRCQLAWPRFATEKHKEQAFVVLRRPLGLIYHSSFDLTNCCLMCILHLLHIDSAFVNVPGCHSCKETRVNASHFLRSLKGSVNRNYNKRKHSLANFEVQRFWVFCSNPNTTEVNGILFVVFTPSENDIFSTTSNLSSVPVTLIINVTHMSTVFTGTFSSQTSEKHYLSSKVTSTHLIFC